MKTNRLVLAMAVTGGLFLASCGGNHTHEAEGSAENAPEAPAAEPQEVVVDLGGSNVKWTGEMLGIKAHYGNIALSEAKLILAGDKVNGGTFVIDMTTIEPKDDVYDSEHTPEKLVGHLSSPDFFDVANHPTATFEITSVSEDGSTATGKLTVRGITNEETVKDIKVADGTVSGTLTFDRKKYDVAWDAPMKDAVLSNDIPLEITLKVAG
ncbi:MAG: YceI family protein [Flavobacteriales bacterium]|nr:YceI family protein [Flavobacteriales bacterium]